MIVNHLCIIDTCLVGGLLLCIGVVCKAAENRPVSIHSPGCVSVAAYAQLLSSMSDGSRMPCTAKSDTAHQCVCDGGQLEASLILLAGALSACCCQGVLPTQACSMRMRHGKKFI